MTSFGVIYMAWGENAVRQAEESIWSLRRQERGMPVMVVGDEAAESHFLKVRQVQFQRVDVNPFNENRSKGFKFLAGRIKPLLAGISPWDQTLYVDADTCFKRSPMVGFSLLDRWDVVIAETQTRSLAPGVVGEKEARATAAEIGSEQILYHNSGMIFWRRNERTDRLFDLWSEEWLRYGDWDEQVALLRALIGSEAVFLTVPYTWNCHTSKEAHLLHHWFGAGNARTEMRRFSARSQQREARKMVKVEIKPGRFVKCYAGDEEKVLEHYRNLVKGRPL